MNGWRSLVLITVVFLTVSCGGGGSSPASDSNNTTNTNDTTNTPPVSGPSITGFDFSLKEGDFWEYNWDYYTSTVFSGGGSSGTTKGVFRVTLGSPFVVGDLTAYPFIFSGNNRDGIDGVNPFITPRWTHIAINDNQILLSSDGMDFKTVFDANTGFSIGFGFFEELSEQNLFEISTGTIDNDYMTEPAFILSDSSSQSNCEFFPSYGTICGADVSVDFTQIRREFYQQAIGPVGYYYHYSASTGGTFDSVHVTNTINIGLVASSLRGDVASYTLETEANNTPATASVINYSSLPVTVKGDFSYQADIDVSLPANYAANHYLYLNDRAENEPNDSLNGAEFITLNETVHGTINSSDSGEFRSYSIPGFNIKTSIEDWYQYQMTEARPFDVLLEFYGATDGVDIDLWLFNSSGVIEDYAIGNNSEADGSDDSERLRPDLVAGTYFIAVDIWPAADSSPTGSGYSLSLNKSSFGSDPAVTNQVAIKDFYRFSVSSAQGLTITTTPSLGVFVTSPDGETVLASAPANEDAQATQTILMTPILQPGNYLIAVGNQNYYSATTNLDFDTYELTVAITPAAVE